MDFVEEASFFCAFLFCITDRRSVSLRIFIQIIFQCSRSVRRNSVCQGKIIFSKITILIPLSVLNQALVTELAALMKGNPGTTELYFKVSDPDSKTVVDMISRPVKLSVGRELISYLNDRPELEFRIN